MTNTDSRERADGIWAREANQAMRNFGVALARELDKVSRDINAAFRIKRPVAYPVAPSEETHD